MMYKCDMCGCCCRHIGNSEIYKNLDNGHGVCKYLVGNLCSIYNKRPLLCRIDETYNQIFYKLMDIEMYYNLNKIECKKLKKMEE